MHRRSRLNFILMAKKLKLSLLLSGNYLSEKTITSQTRKKVDRISYFRLKPKNNPNPAIAADERFAVIKFFKPPRCGEIQAIKLS